MPSTNPREAPVALPADEWDDAHHIRQPEHAWLTLCGQDAATLHVLPADTTVWPDGNAACWTCWAIARDALGAVLREGEELASPCDDEASPSGCAPGPLQWLDSISGEFR